MFPTSDTGAGTIVIVYRVNKIHRKITMKSLIALIAAWMLSGCAGPAPVLPAPYTVVITADDQLNLDRNGQPTPVQVKIYRLKGVTAFNSSDFFSMYEKDEQILSSDLVSKESFILQPGEAKVLLGKALAEERVLGVFVAYRDLDRAVWRGIAPLPAPKEAGRFSVFHPSFESSYVKVYVGTNKVSVSSNVTEVPVPTSGSVPSMPGGMRLPF